MQSCTLEAAPAATFESAKELRGLFPAIVAEPETVFFDNASTAQKPAVVIDRINRFYSRECSNISRASYGRSTALAARVEETRLKVAEFINSSPDEIAFTGGATESLNTVALSWGMHNLKDQDEIMLCMEDHHSAVFPWLNLQEILSRFGREIKIIPFSLHHTGVYDWADIERKVSSRTRLIALGHIHHLYGMEMDIAEIKALLPEDVLISLDASQSAGHIQLDTRALGADFVSFSGHKMFAASGVGVLYTKKSILQQLWPSKSGSKTAFQIDKENMTLNAESLSGIIECGTLNIAGILSLKTAIEFIESIGIEAIERHLSDLTHYLHGRLKELAAIEFAPGIGRCGCTKGFGIVAFKLKNIDSPDLADYLDSEGILVRAGDHCRGSKEEDDGYIRVSLQIYNTREEIDFFMEVLEDACR